MPPPLAVRAVDALRRVESLRHVESRLCRLLAAAPLLLLLVVVALVYTAAMAAGLLPMYKKATSSAAAALAGVLILIFHYLVVNTLINVALCAAVDAGAVPAGWTPPSPAAAPAKTTAAPTPPPPPPPPSDSLCSDDDADDDELITDVEISAAAPFERRRATARFCFVCRSYKPDGCHHCSSCGRCVLRMDHHCVFVNNCIGFGNYKYFVLLLANASAGCTLTAVLCFRPALRLLTADARLLSRSAGGAAAAGTSSLAMAVVLGWLLALVLSPTLTALLLFHLNLVATDRTTIDCLGGVRRPSMPPHKRLLTNMKHVMGENLWLWPFPTRTSILDDGVAPAEDRLVAGQVGKGASAA